jgi:hypothetical protein
MQTRNRFRILVGVLAALVVPSLACDVSFLAGTTKRDFAEQGLQIRQTQLVRQADGSLSDTKHALFTAERTLRGPVSQRDSVQVVRRANFQPKTETSREIVLFSGTEQAKSFFAARGIDTEEPLVLAPRPESPDAASWLTQSSLVLGTRSEPAPFQPTFQGGVVVAAGDLGGDGATFDRDGDLTGGGAGTVTRYVMNDNLPLHATASFNSAELMELDRGDRVYVQATAPVPAQGNVFVQVQVADRAPYPVGWLPLHWLVVTLPGDADVSIDFEASYGLVAKLIQEQIEEHFYDGCDRYPTYAQQSVVASTPELDDPASIPYGERYDCGELPFGTVESASRKHLTTYEFDSPDAYYEIASIPVVSIDSIHFEVPVKLYRLPWQTRDTYEMRDMSSGWAQQFGDGSADVVEHSHYEKFAANALEDEMVRVHDSDVWFNVTWTAPPGVTAVPGAQAYFNLCWALPGVTIEGATTPMDVDMWSVGGAHSHITGIHWGTVELDPFRVCATAALRQSQPLQGPDVLTNGETTPPIVVELVRASLRDVSLRFVEPVNLYGTFSGWHAPAISYLESWLTAIGENEGLLGLLFQAFLEGPIEDRMSEQLFALTTQLASALPEPEHEIGNACNRLMPSSYRQPTSRWYPFYQHCLEATRHAEVTLFSNAIEHTQSCHDRSTYARANDGSAWTRRSDNHDVYYEPVTEDPIGIDRPYWVTQCEVEAVVDTQLMSGYDDVLDCAANVLDEGLNFRRSMSWVSSEAQSRCLTPTVGLLCDLYGEGDDLIELWTEALGSEPELEGYTRFCDWYASLTAPDLPDFTTDPD